MAFVLMVVIALVGTIVYLFFAMSSVPGVKEERWGTLEALPKDVGQWKVDETSQAAREAGEQGLLREVRHFYHEPQGFAGGGRLVLQVRYRNRETKKISHVEPEQTVQRRRVRS